MMMSRFALWMCLVGAMTLAVHGVYAQDYPNKPIRIVTAAAGGGSDFDARLVAQGISGPLGQPVIIDNRASAVLAAEFVAKAPSDGYNLLVAGSVLWTTPLLRQTPYDAIRDFTPISLIEWTVYLVAVHPSLPAKSVKELIALAKARPGELNYSSTVTGAGNHLAAELFKSMAGVNISRVPYKASAAAVAALAAGEVQVTIMDAPSAAPFVKSGRLRSLAVTSAAPSALAPGLPTVSASGLPGYEFVGLTGMLAPAKTPPAIINRLNQEVVRVLNLPDVKEKLLNIGSEVIGGTPEQFAAALKSDVATLSKVIKDAGIKAE